MKKSKIIKLAISFSLCVVMIFGLVIASNNGVKNLFGLEAAATDNSGSYGNVDYVFDPETGLLTLSGKGDAYPSSAPWDDFRSSIVTVKINEGITGIGASAFKNCTKLEEISLPTTLVNIGSSAFYNCSALKAISIPTGVTSINNYTFYGCSSITNISIPEKVTSIGSNAFEYCTSLSSIDLNDITSIGGRVFYGCSSLKNITIPNTLTSADSYPYTFDGSSITTATLEDGMTTIPAYLFYDCTSLQTVTIPSTVTAVGSYAFYDCSNLKDVYYSLDLTSWNAITVNKNNDPLAGATIHCNWCTSENHIHNVVTEKTEPKCVIDGKEVKKCDYCGVILKTTTIKATGHTDKDLNGICDICEKDVSEIISAPIIILIEPENKTVNVGATFTLQVQVENLPEGAKVQWSVNGTGFEITPADDGLSCKVKASSAGNAKITAKLVDSNGIALTKDGSEFSESRDFTAKSAEKQQSFFERILSFFQMLFALLFGFLG